MFRGDAATHNPEDLFLAAVSSCHTLSYLALCTRRHQRARLSRRRGGDLVLTPDGGGRFEEIRLRPVVTIANAADKDRALELHHRAHEVCYIANLSSVPIRHNAEIRV